MRHGCAENSQLSWEEHLRNSHRKLLLRRVHARLRVMRVAMCSDVVSYKRCAAARRRTRTS